MNALRRKEIQAIRHELEILAIRIRDLSDEEREYYDNMPESFQSGEKGEAADAAATLLEESADGLDDVLNQLEEAEQ